jgi:hypothetical protein
LARNRLTCAACLALHQLSQRGELKSHTLCTGGSLVLGNAATTLGYWSNLPNRYL